MTNFIRSITMTPGRYSRLHRVAASKRWRWREGSTVDVTGSPSRIAGKEAQLIAVVTLSQITIEDDELHLLTGGHSCLKS